MWRRNRERAARYAALRPVVFSMVEVAPKDDLAFRTTLANLQSIYETEGVDIRPAVPWRPDVRPDS